MSKGNSKRKNEEEQDRGRWVFFSNSGFLKSESRYENASFNIKTERKEN